MALKSAVQLFTLREECKADFPGTLREISQIGYAGVQFAGYHDSEPQHLKAVLDETGLQVAGLHIGLNELLQETDRLISEARLFGTPDLIVPTLPLELRNEAGYRQVKRELSAKARELKSEGIRVSYHNHAFEFDTMIDGKEALSYLLEQSEDNDLLAELDVYWLLKGGFNPVDYIKPYTDRMPIIHLKDMTADEERAFAPVGTGVIDFSAIIQWGETSGVEWYVVEQDLCKISPLESVRISYGHLSKLLQG